MAADGWTVDSPVSVTVLTADAETFVPAAVEDYADSRRWGAFPTGRRTVRAQARLRHLKSDGPKSR